MRNAQSLLFSAVSFCAGSRTGVGLVLIPCHVLFSSHISLLIFGLLVLSVTERVMKGPVIVDVGTSFSSVSFAVWFLKALFLGAYVLRIVMSS